MKFFWLIFIIIIVGILFVGYSEYNFNDGYQYESVDAASDWFLNMQNEDGMMKYNYFYQNKTFDEDDNIVRQTCAFYSLVVLYEQTGRDDLKDAIYKFKEGLQKYVVYKRFRGEELAYLEVDYTANINSNAIYVLTLVEMKRAGLELSQRDLRDIEKFVNGIVMQADERGGFWYIYFLEEEKNKLDYYGTGEAQLALISYYKYFDNSREDLKNLTIDNFEKFYPHVVSYDFDTLYGKYFLWGLLYLREMHDLDGSLKWRLYIEKMLQKAVEHRDQNSLCVDEGCIVRFDAGEYAYFEGMAAVYSIINEDRWFVTNETLELLNLSEELILSWQVMDREDKFAYGGFCNSFNCTNIRIDYTQHAIDGVVSLVESDYYATHLN